MYWHEVTHYSDLMFAASRATLPLVFLSPSFPPQSNWDLYILLNLLKVTPFDLVNFWYCLLFQQFLLIFITNFVSVKV